MSATAPPVRDRMKAWASKNPLRLWLDAQPLGTALRLAEELGVSRVCLYAWMRGEHDPSLVSFGQIVERTGITLQAWVLWQQGRPK